MEMKWHPIEDGNMEELNRDAQYIFTVEIIPIDGKPVRIVTIGVPYEMSYMKFVNPDVRDVEYKAWAEVPEPYEPGGCDVCKHWKQWTDEFGDRWSKCELWNKPFRMDDCPLR